VGVTPTTWGRVNGLVPWVVDNWISEYKAKVAAKYETTQLLWQLGCHVEFAPYKGEWHLDTWRYRSSYFQYVLHACN